MRENGKIALSLWGKLIAATFMAAILFLSLSVLFNALFSHKVGYYILERDESGVTTTVETHYFAEGEDENTEVTLKENQSLSAIKELSPGMNVTFNLVSQLLMLLLIGIFPYNTLWPIGCKDDNLVTYGHAPYDLLRGLKVGALATIPAALLYLGLVLSVCGVLPSWYFGVYRILNIQYLPYINAVTGVVADPTQIGALAVIALAATLLFVPAISAGAYWLGYKQISLHERLTYESKKKPAPRKPRSHEEI